MDEPRYAIYFVPPADSALYRFGAGVLGYDCYTGESLPPPRDFALAASEWDALTREARKYGFHATLKAPFRLLPPFSEADLATDSNDLPPSRERSRRSDRPCNRSQASSPSSPTRRAWISIDWRRTP